MIQKAFFLLFLLFICGCAVSQPQVHPPVKNSEILQYAYDQVWPAALQTVSSMGLPIITAEKESGLISTQSVQLKGSFNIPARIKRVAYLSAGILEAWNDARYSLNITIKKIDEQSSEITVTPYIEGFENNISRAWVSYPSNGVIEQEVTEAIKSRL